MAEDNSFLRKVVRFVANPTTDWAELNTRPIDPRELEQEKSELKAMVERKRRNDFVRKREFDMLRRVRREGLTPDQMAALGMSSKLDDTGARPSSAGPITRSESSVTAKIDDIEREMVGEGGLNVSVRSPMSRPADEDTEMLPALPPLADDRDSVLGAATVGRQTLAAVPSGLAPMSLATLDAFMVPTHSGEEGELEVSEIVQDPDLDEAVIAFANADFAQCEGALQALTAPGGVRERRLDTWLVLFDLYRATGQQARFDSLSLELARRFGRSGPVWLSLPRQVSDAISVERPTSKGEADDHVGWTCPEALDTEGVAMLRSQALQLPLPWVFDWTLCRRVDPEAAAQLSHLFRAWATQRLEMHWFGTESLLTALAEAAPTGVRDADPVFWMARLDVLRLINRAAQFDDAAVDYCMTYELSPPAWEPARCTVRSGGLGGTTHTQPLSIMSEVSTSFMESTMFDQQPGMVEVAKVELSGQLAGDIGKTLMRLDQDLGSASVVTVSCAWLIRVDFIAAGDLLNWVLTKRGEGRNVEFVEVHRLVALFFGAMGINEHASVHVRRD